MAGVRLLDGVHAKWVRMVLIEIEVTSGILRSFLQDNCGQEGAMAT
jgi:hypothetical protein